MKVCVLKGGISRERDVSLRSGAAMAAALTRKGHQVTEIDVGLDFPQEIQKHRPDAVVLALHGKYGEDGVVQAHLEWLKIPYTGSSVLASALCFDKRLTKEVVEKKGVRIPQGFLYQGEPVDAWVAGKKIPYPAIVKPNTEGSSIGLFRVNSESELAAALSEAIKLDKAVLVEETIVGHEVTVGVLNGRPLPVVEVKPKSGVYDFASKYTKGATEYEVPAKLSEKVTQALQKSASLAFHALGCWGAARADFIVNAQDEPVFLEMNTLPGMTETSLLPKAAQAAGISFDDLCEEILKSARLHIA